MPLSDEQIIQMRLSVIVSAAHQSGAGAFSLSKNFEHDESLKKFISEAEEISMERGQIVADVKSFFIKNEGDLREVYNKQLFACQQLSRRVNKLASTIILMTSDRKIKSIAQNIINESEQWLQDSKLW